MRTAIVSFSFAICSLASAAGVLYEGPGMHGSIIVEEDTAGMRTLRFERNGARQSVVKPGDPDHLELSYSRTMLAGLALSERIQRVLVLGLGGGSLPMFLHKNFSEARIDIAEIDPAVIRVAERFFGVRQDDRLRIHAGDARAFVEASAPSRYDVIFVDAFGANSSPAHLTTQEFARALRRAVGEDGMVLGNLWHRPFNAQYDSMLLTYRSVFDSTFLLDNPGDANSILVAMPRAYKGDREQLAARAAALSRSRNFRVDLGAIVNRAFKPFPPSGLEGKILVDRDLKAQSSR